MLFIANGPWTNWEYSINDPKNGDLITWGTKDSQSHLSFYNKLKVGDTVFMANQPPPNNGPYKRKVVFGFGEVVRLYQSKIPYWPSGSGWLNRLDIKPMFVAKTDKDASDWSNRLAPYGLRTIGDDNAAGKDLEDWAKEHGMSSKATFSFVKKDFESTTKKKSDAEYRRERFKLLGKVMTERLSPYFKNFKIHNGAVNARATKKKIKEAVAKGLGGVYVSYSWFGYHFSDAKYMKDLDEIQFQVSLDARDLRAKHTRLPLAVGLWIDANAREEKKYAAKQITENSKKFLELLQRFPTYGIGTHRNGKWDVRKISDLKEKDIPIIANELKFAGTEFLIMRGFGQPEAISLKNKVVDEFSNTFDEMIPIREFLSRTKVGWYVKDLTQTSGDGDPMSNEDCDDFKKKGYFRILDEKLQMIFYGPPGTGKTWTANKLAKCWCKPENIEKVTFHPSYSYEDFVEGFRPVVGNNSGAIVANYLYGGIKVPEEFADHESTVQNIVRRSRLQWIKGASNGTTDFEMIPQMPQYVLEPGIFKRICERAKKSNEKYVLIIDEINRGNISKILGEMITLIEANYRGPDHKLKLAYSQEDFYVPKNLYIIGTMNTADKSLAQVDAALRRRFAFEELMPNADVLKEEVTDIPYTESIIEILKHLNTKITESGRSRSEFRDKQIGHSYFMKVKNADDLQFVFKHEIIPLLQDYFHYNYDLLRDILGVSTSDDDNDGIIMKDEDRPNEKIFEKTKAEEFVTALRKKLDIVVNDATAGTDTETVTDTETGTEVSENN